MSIEFKYKIHQIVFMVIEDIIIGRDPEDLKKYEKTGCIFLGRHIVGRGYDYHLTNPILMDALRPHVILITGKRGSGKSYTSALMAEEIMNLPDEIKQNLTCLMIDTMGIFWSMKNPNDQDVILLSEWGLKPQGFPVQNFVPIGLTDFYDKSGISYDGMFAIKPSELSAGDWALTFDISLFEPLGILLERTIKKLKGRDFSIQDIINEIESDKRSDEKEKLALENRFLSAEGWGIFSAKATRIEDFLKPGIATILDVSLQDWNVRNLMLGIALREIYQARISARREEELAVIGGEAAKKIPMTWIIIDECENFLPVKKETAATHDLLTLIKQGRQPGISMVLITQRPNKIHEDAIAQADLVISHRLTAKPDLEALSAIMQTYLLFDIRKSLEELPKSKGAALILDDNSERLFNVQVRPRQSWHAGGSPIALKEKTT
jgi:DNA helicase HerA-like ATPase